jgi:hypothetical protein
MVNAQGSCRLAKNMQAPNRVDEKEMTNETDLGGSFTLRGASMTLRRMGYGAMQLAGPEVWGAPADVNAESPYCERQSPAV